jgi:ABC-type enterochelin transport system substrate-binding protein
MADRLPGFGAIRRRRGRNELAVDKLAGYLRKLHQFDPWREAVIKTARTTAASLDRLEHDDDRSEHVVGSVSRVHLEALEKLRPALIPTGDAFDRMLDELSASLRDAETD